jgi:hypothetical protein
MHLIPQPSGPFKSWPFFQPQEIETIACDDLRAHGLFPKVPGEVNVELLVSKLFGFDPVYRETGDGILGYVRFGLLKPETIVLHESLGALNAGLTTEHRCRSTLAHEIGHARLHVGPFTELMQAKKLGRATERVRNPSHHANFMCRTTDIREDEGAKGPPGLATWERMAEWQANRYMAAVLTPASLVRQSVTEIREDFIFPTEAELAAEISRQFKVSRQLAGYRLAELFAASALCRAA